MLSNLFIHHPCIPGEQGGNPSLSSLSLIISLISSLFFICRSISLLFGGSHQPELLKSSRSPHDFQSMEVKLGNWPPIVRLTLQLQGSSDIPFLFSHYLYPSIYLCISGQSEVSFQSRENSVPQLILLNNIYRLNNVIKIFDCFNLPLFPLSDP